jgi:hypothetical protein
LKHTQFKKENIMNHKKYEKGQALIIIVFAIVGLIGITGLTVDGGRTFADRQSAQSSADAAALGAALAKVRGQDITARALGIAATNGYVNNTTHDTITVTNPPGPGCKGEASVYAGDSQYIHVMIVTNVDTYFAPVIGIPQTHNCVEATARGTTNFAGSPAYGLGITTLKPNGHSLDFTGSGPVTIEGGITSNGDLDLSGSGDVIVTQGMRVFGTLDISTSGDWTIGGNTWVNGFDQTGSGSFAASGGFFDNGNFKAKNLTVGGAFSIADTTPTISGTVTPWLPPTQPTILSASTSTTLLTDPFINPSKPSEFVLNPPLPEPTTCYPASNSSATRTLNPGCYVSIKQSGSNTLTLNPGIYYITGADGFVISGSSNLVAEGVLLYLKTGEIDMTGSGSYTLSPMMDEGNPYKGLSIYMDRANTNSYKQSGAATSAISGTIYAPSSEVTVNGSGGTLVIDSQIISSTTEITGSGGINLNYDASKNYQPPNQAAVELIK